jgi:hypothetical protein
MAENENEMCCEPDWDYEKGQHVHEKNCWGSIEANEDRDAEAIAKATGEQDCSEGGDASEENQQ